jgi:O-antigen ligase
MKIPATVNTLLPLPRSALVVSSGLLFVLVGYVLARDLKIGLVAAVAFASLCLLLAKPEVILYATIALLVIGLDEGTISEFPERMIFRLNIGHVYLMEFAVFGLLAVHILKRLSKRSTGVRESIFASTPLDRPLLAFAFLLPIYGLYGLAQGNPFQSAVGYNEWRSLFLAIVFYFLVVTLVETGEEARHLFWWFFSLVGLKALAFLVLYSVGVESALPLVFGGGPFRAGPENIMFAFAALGAISLLVCKIERGPWVRGFVLLTALATVSNLVLGSKRNSQTLLVLGNIVLAWLLPKRAKRKWAAAMVGAVALFFFISVLMPKKAASDVSASAGRYDEIVEFLQSGTVPISASGTFAFHAYDWLDAWEAIKQHPLIGHGFGGDFKRSYTALPGVMGPAGVPAGMVHNQYLHFWWKMGLPGLVVFLWTIIRYLRVGYRRIPSIPSLEGRAIAWGLYSAMWGVCAGELWGAGFVGCTKQPFLIYFSMALVICLARNQGRVATNHNRAPS